MAAARPSLYEAPFAPNRGHDLADIKASRIHSGLLGVRAGRGPHQPADEKDDGDGDDDGGVPPGAASSAVITKSYVDRERYGERAIVLHNVLSPDECSQIAELFTLLEVSEATSDKRYRNGMRCQVSSVPLAQLLFDRIRPFIADSTRVVTAENCSGFQQNTLMIGDWHMEAVNDYLRLSYYAPEGHLGPHYDGEINPDANVCSIKTLLIYLNDDYVGGATNFVAEHELYFDTAKNIYRSPASAVVASVKGRRGDALVFDHKLLHEGGILESGTKCIIQSELMYRRVDRMTAAEREGRAWLDKARTFEHERDGENAVRCYRAAFRLCPALESIV